MSSSFLDKFAASPLFRQSELVPSTEIDQLKNKIKNEVNKLPEGAFLCLLKTMDGPEFCFRFFALLDRGLIPLGLSKESYAQVCESFKKAGRSFYAWDETPEKQGVPQVENFKNCYACLTSGTTSDPKLCYLSTEGALKNATAHAQSMQLTTDHMLLQSLPLYHSFGLVTYLWTCLQLGCGLNFFPTFLGMKSLRKVRGKNQVLAISPGQLRFMLKEKGQDSSGLEDLKIISIGGGLANHHEIVSLQEKLSHVKLYVTYGLTEAGPRVLTGLWSDAEEGGFIGKAMQDIELKVLENDKVLDEGEGILLVKGPSVKLNLEETEQAGDYLMTRDRVKLSTGRVYFLGRGEDLIKVGGLSVYPRDIEVVCRRHPEVKDCLVLKKDDNLYGEVPLLFVEGSLKEEDLVNYLKDKLTVYQMPKKIFLFESFPRHSLQKINRKELLKGI